MKLKSWNVRTMKNTESQNIEFKTNWRDEYLKVICAFANTDGGELIIGIDDRGEPVGVKNSKKLLENIPNKVKDILGIMPKVTISKKQNKEILVINVKPSYAPISYKGGFFIRSGSTTQEL